MFNKLSSSIRKGISFGLNSGVITTTGVLAGLSQATNNPMIIIITILSLAISDGIGEGYGIYISQKAGYIKDKSSGPLISFISLLIMKIIICMSFLLPLLFSNDLKYFKNLVWPLAWGIFLLFILDYKLAESRNEKIQTYLIPHTLLILFVVIATKISSNILSKYSD